jgi:hypothetical protein
MLLSTPHAPKNFFPKLILLIIVSFAFPSTLPELTNMGCGSRLSILLPPTLLQARRPGMTIPRGQRTNMLQRYPLSRSAHFSIIRPLSRKYSLADFLQLMWYRNLYLPKPADRHNWHASPIFAPEENFAKLPPTFVTVAEIGMSLLLLLFVLCHVCMY